MSDIDLAAPLYGLAQMAVMTGKSRPARRIAIASLGRKKKDLWESLVQAEVDNYVGLTFCIQTGLSPIKWKEELGARHANVMWALWCLVHPLGTQPCASCLGWRAERTGREAARFRKPGSYFFDPVRVAMTIPTDTECPQHAQEMTA